MVILRFPIRRIDSIGIPLISLISHLVVGFMRLPIRPLALVILLTRLAAFPPLQPCVNKPRHTSSGRAGQADAQYRLGLMYEDHLGVPQDYQQAYAWFLKAAEQGQADAQYRLGLMYENNSACGGTISRRLPGIAKRLSRGKLKLNTPSGECICFAAACRRTIGRRLPGFAKQLEQGMALAIMSWGNVCGGPRAAG